jgi:hypothetical protein
MSDESLDQLYCSVLSVQAGEPLIASATPTTVYMLLEYNGAWETKAMEESDLPEEVKSRLKAFTKASPNTKLQLIRRPPGERSNPKGMRFYVALTGEDDPRLYSLELQDYDELVDLDLLGMAAGGAEFEAFRSTERLALVCVNGRRDRCCAKFGTAVYNALSQAVQGQEGIELWQSTHMGGHRFAANFLWLPEGVLYGRVDPESARAILKYQQAGQVYLPNLRGRTCYERPAQAAELYLRQRSGEFDLKAYRLLEIKPVEEGSWQVRFQSTRDELTHDLKIHLQVTDIPVYDGCTLDKTTPLKRYLQVE